eukprot:gene8168-9602_t
MFQGRKGKGLQIKVDVGPNSNRNINSNNTRNVGDGTTANPTVVGNAHGDGTTFSLTNSGTFKEGDLAINMKGLLIKGESPKNSPLNNADRRKPLPDLKITKILGRGQGGTVSLAYHAQSNSLFALKVIILDVQETVRKQILLELKTLHRTHCPYVVSFYDAFYSEGSVHIVLEYMDGGSLADLLKVVKIIPEPLIAKLAQQILQGLMYLHRKLHLIHRDIKPSNILINGRGEAKISDFGVSSQRHDTLSKAVTWVGTVNHPFIKKYQSEDSSSLEEYLASHMGTLKENIGKDEQ